MRIKNNRMFLFVGLFLLLWQSLFAQNSEQYSLGRSTLYSVPTAHSTLTEATPLFQGLASSVYLGKVGGVAFESVAAPKSGIPVGDISLQYQPSNADGARLLVNINGKWVIAPIYDWHWDTILLYLQHDRRSSPNREPSP